MPWLCYLKTKEKLVNFPAFCYSLTPVIQPLTETEFFLDLGRREPFKLIKTVYSRYPQHIQHLGISQSKFLAKAVCPIPAPRNLLLAQGLKIVAPGTAVIPRGKEKDVAACLPVSSLWPFSRAVISKLHALGINTLGEAARLSLDTLTARFGSDGYLLYHYSRGQDREKIQALYPPPQLIWEQEVTDLPPEKLFSLVSRGAKILADLLEKHDFSCRRIALTVTAEGKQLTTAHHFSRPKHSKDSLSAAATALLRELQPAGELQKLGLAVSQLLPPHREQLDLFALTTITQQEKKQDRLLQVCETLSLKYHPGAVNWGKHLLPSRREQLLAFWDPLRAREKGIDNSV